MEKKLMDANEAHEVYGVTRAWLRGHRNAGTIRCSETHGKGRDGRPYVRYFYNVQDIERELRMFSPRGCGWQGARQAGVGQW